MLQSNCSKKKKKTGTLNQPSGQYLAVLVVTEPGKPKYFFLHFFQTPTNMFFESTPKIKGKEMQSLNPVLQKHKLATFIWAMFWGLDPTINYLSCSLHF